MTDDFTDPAQKKVGGAIGTDLYGAGKEWLARLDPLGDKLSSYRNGVKLICDSVSVMGMSGSRELQQLFVSIRLYRNQKKYAINNKKYDFDKLKHTAVEVERNLLRTNKRADVESAIEYMGYRDLVEEYEKQVGSEIVATNDQTIEKRFETSARGDDALKIALNSEALLILGQPGGGKTTFVKYLALVHTQFVSAPLDFNPLLPIFISLKDFRRVAEPNPDSSWFLSLVQSCAKDIGGSAFNDSWLLGYLNSGDCILLIDGIDEIPAENLGTVLNSLNSFRIRFRKNKFIATCRVAAFSFALHGFEICEIDDFRDDDIHQFIKSWFHDNPEIQTTLLVEIKKNSSIKELCKTPLLMTLVCVLYDYSRSIPKNRAELYDECINAMLFRWDTYRGIERSNFVSLTPQRKKLILAYIADWTFTKGAFYFKRGTLLSLIATQLERSNIDDIAPTDVLNEIEQNNGLFVERAVDVFSFSHLTFHEYFCAEACVLNRKESELLQNVLLDVKYKEVFLLVLERLPAVDSIIIDLLEIVKQRFIDQELDSSYIRNLLYDIYMSQASMDSRLRKCIELQYSEFDRFDTYIYGDEEEEYPY